MAFYFNYIRFCYIWFDPKPFRAILYHFTHEQCGDSSFCLHVLPNVAAASEIRIRSFML